MLGCREGGMTTTRTPMLIKLYGRLCGRAYVPTREDIACGPEVYHRCPECRPPERVSENVEVPSDA
jgi:hypothetical protein